MSRHQIYPESSDFNCPDCSISPKIILKNNPKLFSNYIYYKEWNILSTMHKLFTVLPIIMSETRNNNGTILFLRIDSRVNRPHVQKHGNY